jgi:hypothetical protein
LLGAMSAWAIDTATIGGVVTDPSGAVVPEVAVIAASTSTLLARAATTNTQGSYVFPNLRIGLNTGGPGKCGSGAVLAAVGDFVDGVRQELMRGADAAWDNVVR